MCIRDSDLGDIKGDLCTVAFDDLHRLSSLTNKAQCERAVSYTHLDVYKRQFQCAVPDVHRQAVELCGAEGHQQGSVEADAALFAAHDPGTDQLLDHQRIRPVLCA